jgi:hypothetical protein
VIDRADRNTQLVLALAAGQLLDAIGNALWPRQRVLDHLDHLGVPRWLRPALPVIKVTGSAALVAGLRWPRFGATTALALVGYYAAAAEFHVLAGDHPMMAAPAAAFGAAAGAVVVTGPAAR